MFKTPAAIAAATLVSLAAFWIIAVLGIRFTLWFSANAGRFPSSSVLFASLAFCGLMMFRARRRRPPLPSRPSW